MVLFDGMTQLDLTGPLEVFSRFPNAKVYLISKSDAAVNCDRGLRIIPDTTFADCPQKLNVLFVPGGPGVTGLLTDNEYLNFVHSRGNADYITSVCTGSILLAACGLLNGFRATSHWLSLSFLERFNVKAEKSRVVIDGNRITGAGVTSGIDLALTMCAKLFGDAVAMEIQLLIEYDPRPPFNSGHPDLSEESIVKKVVGERVSSQRRRLDEIDLFLSSDFWQAIKSS
jgi:cyclohexyl-isocyanide hydratase